MIRTNPLFILTTLLLLLLLWSPVALAQTPENVIVIYPAVDEQDESLALSVFFTIVDGTGRPIPQANINSVEIELLGGSDVPVPASFGDPKTPFYVAILLDTSGSMQPVMGSVREAAQEAINNAPQTAFFSVIPFNELKIQEGDELHPAADFTSNHGLVQNTINRVEAIPGASTCLYDATYKAVELLDRQIQSPQERRAIILFTDGKDERRDEAGPCSFYGYENVIDKALPTNAPGTSIHTIGLCEDAGCGNIDQFQLRNMALDTFAFSAFGQQTELRELFKEIMTGLSSQWVAQTNVYAHRGDNQAALVVTLNDNTELSTTFHFFSGQEYKRPALPVSAEFTGIGYDPESDTYSLALSLTSPESVHQVVIEVWDTKRGIQVGSPQTFEEPGPTVQANRDTAGFESGGEYAFRVKAVDEQGFLIKNKKGETILAENGIVYEPPQTEVVYSIQSVEVNDQTGKLLIDLEVLDKAQEFNKYEGFIKDTDTGQKIHSFGPVLFPGTRIEEALPDIILKAQEPKSYEVALYLTTKGESRLQSEPYEFKIIPPPPPGLLTRVWTVVKTPVILGSILIIILIVLLVIIIWSRPARQKPLPKPLEIRTPTTLDVGRGVPSRPASAQKIPSPMTARVQQPQPRVRLEVVQTPDPPSQRHMEIKTFPFTIGRENCNLIIPSRHISRRHLTITVQNGQLMVIDLGSSNGTFVNNQRLAPNVPKAVIGPSTIQLGQKTHLKLSPL